MMNVKEYQHHLAGLGYHKGECDGIYGPATRQGVYNFQLAYKNRPDGSVLEPDGLWGPKTERALRSVIGSDEKPQHPAPEPVVPIVGYKWVSVDDFKCRCGGRYCNGWPAKPHKATLDLLEQIGEHYQKRIVPHSGLRCPHWNAHEGGASTSKHMYGMAMDFHVSGVPHQELYNFCDSLLGNSGGLGIYSWGVHIDDRPVKGRWDYR